MPYYKNKFILLCFVFLFLSKARAQSDQYNLEFPFKENVDAIKLDKNGFIWWVKGYQDNIALGIGSLITNSTGFGNTAFGINSLTNNSLGFNNVAISGTSLLSNSEGNNNIALGANSLHSNTIGDNNVALGSNTLYHATSNDNIAIGNEAMYGVLGESTGGDNIAIGDSALYANTSGENNIAQGVSSLFFNSTGSNNIASGFQSLYGNTMGIHNIANGFQSLYNNTYGCYNIANGYQSLFNNSSGLDNVANGYQSLWNNTIGSNNIAIGRQSLTSNILGNNNIALGFDALATNSTGSGNVAIGFNAGKNETGSNKLYIENTSAISTEALIYGDFNNDLLRFNGQVGINNLNSNIGFSIQNPNPGPDRIVEAISSTGITRMMVFESGRAGFNGSFPSIGVTIRNPTPAPPKIVEAISSAGTARMTVYEDGRVYVRDTLTIGITTPAEDYALSVDGKIIGEEFTQLPSSSWPDYVFEKDYPLMSISKLESSIRELGHLPGIPSAAEIESKGQDLGEINRLQMEKIEELTLYIIQLEKRLRQLEKAR